MRALNVLLSVLVSLLLALLVLEGGLRLLPQFRPQETLNRFDPLLGWSKKADAEVERETSELDITIRTNSEGLRDDTPVSKPPGTHRVLMLGDSFVLGYTVDREDLFVDRLERWWQGEGRDVDVVNAGTEGYSTDQEVLWFLEHGGDYEPDVVLLFPYENDIYWNGQTSYTRFPKPRFRPDGTVEERELVDPGPAGWLSRFAIGRFLERQVLPRLRRPSGPPPDHFRPDGRDAWVYGEFAPLLEEPPPFLGDAVARTRGALSTLQERCEELGAVLAVVPIPSESAIHPEERQRFQENALRGLPADAWSPDRPVEIFLDLARELDIASIDPRRALREAAEEGEERLYFEAEWHFNPRGNEVFASFLHEELDARQAFPPEHAAQRDVMLTARSDGGGLPGWSALFAALWLLLGACYAATYRDEKAWLGFLKVGGLLAVVFAIVLGGGKLIGLLPPAWGPWILLLFVLIVLGFVAWKLGRRVGTITELLKAFTLRGHWYLMPLVVVLLTIGSLLVVAASSPLIAPFIYTLF